MVAQYGDASFDVVTEVMNAAVKTYLLRPMMLLLADDSTGLFELNPDYDSVFQERPIRPASLVDPLQFRCEPVVVLSPFADLSLYVSF